MLHSAVLCKKGRRNRGFRHQQTLAKEMSCIEGHTSDGSCICKIKSGGCS
jgi:hypothetical protein